MDEKQKPFHGGSMDIFWNCTMNMGDIVLYCWGAIAILLVALY